MSSITCFLLMVIFTAADKFIQIICGWEGVAPCSCPLLFFIGLLGFERINAICVDVFIVGLTKKVSTNKQTRAYAVVVGC